MKYVTESLAFTGFAVLNSRVAISVRPDIWGDGLIAMADFSSNEFANNVAYVKGCESYMAQLQGHTKPVQVIARCADQLAERIYWVTGCVVSEIHAGQPESEPTEAPNTKFQEVQKREAERIAYLNRIAAQEPPAHVCALSKEIHAARAELKRMKGE
jgi:hypothetical protein